MIITVFIVCILTAFYLGFTTKAYFLSDHEHTQKILHQIKNTPKTTLNNVQKTILAQHRIRSILKTVVELAEQGDSHAMWTLYKAKKCNKIYYKDISIHFPYDKLEGHKTFVIVFGTFWPTEQWLNKLVQQNYWSAMVEKARKLLKENNSHSNKKAVTLLEQIKNGMGYSFVESCKLLTPIFKNGITGVSANPSKYNHYASFGH